MSRNARRHLITETPELASALDAAVARWPELAGDRAGLLVRLAEEGRRSLDEETDRHVRDRRAALDRTSGVLTGSFGPGYLDELRDGWCSD